MVLYSFSFFSTFQSAPLTKARGDDCLVEDIPLADRFNPLPSQKQGETTTTKRVWPDVVVSIRSPHKSKGRRGMNRSSMDFS